MNCFWNFCCTVWASIGGHIARHAEGYGLGAGAAGLSIVKNWPVLIPKTLQDWWDWARNSAQTALPISRSGSPSPTMPVDPAKTNK